MTSVVISRGSAVPAFSQDGTGKSASVLRISEVMSSNQNAIVDPKGGYADWCEFQNVSSQTLNLSHFGLSNDLMKPGKWGFPSMELKPGEYVVVWLGGRAEVDERYPLFCAFKLSAGETLYLFDSAGDVLDLFKVESSESNVSYIHEGSAYTRCETPTPGYPNTEAGYESYRAANRVENSDLILNEIVAKNTLTVPDETGAYHDWIELYNRGDAPILLTGYGLSDDPKAPMKWVFPTGSIGPGEYLLVYASGQDRHADGQRIHTSFSLSAGGETVTLSDNMGRQLDQTTYADLPDNAAWARIPGSDEWEVRGQPTPEQPNTPEGERAIQEAFFQGNPGLYLSEASNNNRSAFKEPGGAFPDWAELYNATGEAIALGGYGLSDDPERPLLWKFPEDASIGPGEYLVVSLSKDTAVEGLRADFGLDQLGEMLVLAAPDRRIIDYMAVPRLQVDMSYGRAAGQSGFFYYDKSTPGAENGQGYEGYAPDAAPSVPAGVYAAAQSVSLTVEGDNPMDASASGVRIVYTLDGSEPTRDSESYTGPISIEKTTALRVRTYREGYLPSLIQTYTYIVGQEHTLPIISLVTEPDNLFSDSKGIYADGPHYMEEFPHGYDGGGANYWMDWERPVHVEMYQPDGARMLSQDAGIKISGQYSRALDQKSFMVVARSDYGDNRFRAKMFPNREYTEYQSFILRSSAQDYNRARMRDALLTGLMDETDMDYQASQPVVVYINGKYWGQYNLRERINKHFVAQHQGYENPDEVDLLKGNSRELNGSNDEYLELIQYAKTHSLTDPAALKYVTDRVDVENYFDYQIAEMLTGNTDLGNIKYYHARNVEGAKWRWVLYDLDWGFTGSTMDWNPFTTVLNPKGNGVGNMFDNTLIRKLLENADMKRKFLDRLAYHMNNTFALSRVIDRIDALEKQMEPEMARHYARWPEDGSVESWHRQVEYLRDYARQRPDIVLRAAKKYFDLSSEQMIELFGREP